MVTTMTTCVYCVSLSTGCKCTSEYHLNRQKRIKYAGFPVTFQPLTPSLHFCSRHLRTESAYTGQDGLYFCVQEIRTLLVISLTGSLSQPSVNRFIQANSRKFLGNIVTCTFIFALFSMMGKKYPFIARPNAISDAVSYGILYY